MKRMDGNMPTILLLQVVCFIGHGWGYRQDLVRLLNHETAVMVYPTKTVDLVCRFAMENYDMFHNPIVWQKTQLDETTPVNIMGNVMPPFVKTGRFSIGLEDAAPHYKVTLTITDVGLEDYGNYTCEIRGPETSVLARLTHYVHVKTPVHSISISDSNKTIHLTDSRRTLEFKDNTQASISCTTVGGCPVPNMSIFLGSTEITERFSTVRYSKFTGVKGLRIIDHYTESWTDGLHITPDLDNVKLLCTATVPSLGERTATVKLAVIYPPIISCGQVHASLGDRNVSLVCEVKSRPETTSLFWLDGNGTTLSPGHMSHEYWTLNMARGDGKLETHLYIKQVSMASFKSYTVVAENSIGKTTYELSLTQRYKYSSHQSVLQDPSGNTSYSPHLPVGSSSEISRPNCSTLTRLTLTLTMYFYTFHQGHR